MEKSLSIPTKIRRQDTLLSRLWFSFVLEILDNSRIQEKRNKRDANMKRGDQELIFKKWKSVNKQFKSAKMFLKSDKHFQGRGRLTQKSIDFIYINEETDREIINKKPMLGRLQKHF